MLHGAGVFTYKTGSFMGQMLGFIFQHHGAYGHNRLVNNVDFDTHQQKVISTDQNPNQTQGTHIPNLWWLITASWLYPSTPPQPHPNTVVSLIIYIYIIFRFLRVITSLYQSTHCYTFHVSSLNHHISPNFVYCSQWLMW